MALNPDTNNIVILYPQTKRDNTLRVIWGGTMLPNPNACWDWTGWYGNDADQKSGKKPCVCVCLKGKCLD